MNDTNVFSVVAKIQQRISLALFSTYQIFVLQLTTISIKYYMWLYYCLCYPACKPHFLCTVPCCSVPCL